MLAGLEMMHEEPKLFARFKTLLTVREVWDSIPGTVKSGRSVANGSPLRRRFFGAV